ncbi:type II toxin-antitoxin system RelE/ParE family toxin [Acinetobacter sp.]|uniref:type II toxin-antitoxin system RelE/ParE family toxin n=1 Tax=Acinetobacter sp. TaxID=472 RepID=UPI0035B318B0
MNDTYQVVYSIEAEQDLVEILVYGIQTWGEVQAESFYLDMQSKIETLKTQPHRVCEKQLSNGRKVRDFMLLDTPYRAPFIIDQKKQQVIILRILRTERIFKD